MWRYPGRLYRILYRVVLELQIVESVKVRVIIASVWVGGLIDSGVRVAA